MYKQANETVAFVKSSLNSVVITLNNMNLMHINIRSKQINFDRLVTVLVTIGVRFDIILPQNIPTRN